MVTVKKGEALYGQESLRGESIFTVCGDDYQLLTVLLLK